MNKATIMFAVSLVFGITSIFFHGWLGWLFTAIQFMFLVVGWMFFASNAKKNKSA